MKTRNLGNTSLKLTTIGLGTWAIGGPWQYGWGPQDDENSMKSIFEAMDSGINWIDTAPIYGCGHSEEVVGKAIKQMSQKPIIATKCGLLWNEKREMRYSLKSDSILKECDDSLKRLGVDTIDLYQMHWPNPDEDIEQGWEAMVKCQEAGKVRYIGVSNLSVSQLERIKNIHPVASLQPPYSMLNRDIETDILGYCGDNNIGLVVYSPLQTGLLTGKFTEESVLKLPEDDYRRTTDANFQQPQLSRNLKIVDSLKIIASERGKSLAQLAVAWTLSRQEVTSSIVGARKPGQIVETSMAGDWELDANTLTEINVVLKSFE